MPLRNKILQGGTPGKNLVAAALKRQIHQAITFERIGFDDVSAASIQL
ncbi:hypothetical protein [Tunturiibacter gelidoferens]|uniref:Uncharacterized protein n=1 Tax=Tunturiibacter lichenicola TaxID=2051959 RepID=A0A7Y9NLK7_9BACT|nr:hypothetical protein [Edaphobacter lichenicola]NYF51631.1 hypothetical protein [Edaphobacter lichenicola]